MTNNEINVAIAELCGWELSNEIDRVGNRFYVKGNEWRRSGAYPTKYQPIPNYCSDLNAMWEAEETLTQKENQDAYCLELANVCNGCVDWNKERMNVVAWVTMRATASQRAEAFLRTIGKWADDTGDKEVKL